MAHALLIGTLGKIDPQAAKACEKVIGKIPLVDHPQWPKHQRCELNPDLDNTSLHFLASSNTKSAKTALAMSWFMRCVANWDGALDCGISWVDTLGGRVAWKDMKCLFQGLRLDVAIPQARMAQWSRHRCKCLGLCGGFNLRNEAAKLFHNLSKTNAWEKCVRAGLSHESLETHVHVHSPFLRKLILNDLQLSHGLGEVDSNIVGTGALPELIRSAGFRGSEASAMKVASSRLLPKVHNKLAQRLETGPARDFLRKVIPGPWKLKHTQHLCCELRRWKCRSQKKTGRFRDAAKAAARAVLRARRLKKTWQNLGFKKPPTICQGL